MKWKQFALVAFKSILRNKMRGLLTVLGVIIGVASVVSLMSLGKGSQSDIEKSIASLGTNLIMVHPGSSMMGGIRGGAGSGKSLSLKDVDVLRRDATDLKHVSPVISVNERIVAEGENWLTTVSGVTPDYQAIKNYEIVSGTFISDSDVKSRKKVAVLGKTVVKELFNGNDPVGSSVRIRNVPFRVIGVLGEKGTGGMGEDQDDLVLAPSTTVLFRLSDGETVNMIVAGAASDDKMETAKTEMTEILRRAHRIQSDEENDFHVMDQTEIKKHATSITSTMTLLLSAIAGVSLLVGGIGIMNIMLVSVTERTREIGIRLAVGARPGDVLLQFLIEAIMLSVIGGVLGILLGVGIACGLASATGSGVAVDQKMIVLAFSFSAAVGVFFGLYPARKAATLNPIDALRHE